MAKSFRELRERLLRAGVAPRHVRRYLAELADHWADLTREEEAAGRSRADAQTAALLRLGATDHLARAMIEQRQFQSWCARAPWALFTLGPLFVLAGAYLFACLILWSGWILFLPDFQTPFVPISGIAVFYFGVGRLIYFAAPIFIGWGIGFIAHGQRSKAVWPALGSLWVALLGASAHVQAGHPKVPGTVGAISMDFGFGLSSAGIGRGLVHALLIFALMILPFFVARLHNVRSVPR